MIRSRIKSLELAALGAIVLLAGCSSGPKIYTNQDPAANFGDYKTFGFQAKLGTDGDQYASLASQYLKAATVREMTARGYKESSNPDISVNFSLVTEEKIRTTQTPTTGGYYGYRGYGAWGGYAGYETRVTQYTEGTVNLDIIDVKKQQLVWEGVVVGKVTDEVRENLQAVCDEVVTEILSNYPYVAGNPTPQPLAKDKK
jgi:hypothetical protein